jgi:ribonuclease P protein component
VYKHGRRHFAPHMTVFYLPRTDSAGPRVGFTVGRVLGEAVDRNRIKRRMREAVRLNLAKLTASVDVVFNPKKSVLDAEFEELKVEVGRALELIQQRHNTRAKERRGSE